MDLRRTATIGVIGGALAVWLAAAATSGIRDSVPPSGPITPPAIDARGAELATEVQRLHERLRPSAEPHQPGRDLFAFERPKPKAAPIVAPVSVPAEAVIATPVPPPLRLSGLAEDSAPDGTPVRTAIISTIGQLFLAKEGDLVTPRYRVVKISADVVELVDLIDNSTLRLALK
jgi:hypothetical protein